MKNCSKIFFLVSFCLATLTAIGILGLVLWSQVTDWLYTENFTGTDTHQFIHYVFYHFKNPGFPITSWDYFWHNGAPRVLDATWINFFFTRPLVEAWGFYQTIKIYPLISFALFALFTYLIFYELSKSVLISLGMAISFVLGRGLYEGLYGAGVVMSTISQAFFPIQFYFLVRFHQRGTRSNLYLAGIASALGFYFHGMLMMFFGFIPAFFFVLFSTHEGEFFLSLRSLKNSVIFTLIALTVGALGTWPQMLHGFIGGSNSVLLNNFGTYTKVETFKPLVEFTDMGIPLAFVLGLLVAMGILIFGKKRTLFRESLPYLIVFGYGLFWFVTYNFGLHPLSGIIFPGRIFWVFPLTLGMLAAFWLSPLSGKTQAVKSLGFMFLKICLFAVISLNFLLMIANGTFREKIKLQPLKTVDLVKKTQDQFSYFLPFVDQTNKNFRFWTHHQDTNTSWIKVSDIPMSEGYFHFWTKRSRLWEGWFYAVMSRPNFDSQEIPLVMAEKQALYFLDWYGVRYVHFLPGSGEWDLAPYLWQNEAYFDPLKSDPKKGFLTLKSELTSGIVNPVAVPVIGFIGDDDGYMTFQKDLATLGLHTSYLIPLRLGNSINDVSQKDLETINALVFYNYGKQDWDRINKFVQNGGLVWLESGGTSQERENNSLPSVFPIKSSKYGSLGTEWEAKGTISGQIDFSLLNKLIYQNTPWQVSYAPINAVKSGAAILLSQKGNPIAVSQKIGKGKVVWTGGNFWYRPEEFRKNGINEIKIVDLLLAELFGELKATKAKSKIERLTAEKIKITGEGFSGVTFKENKWPGWQARVKYQLSNGQTKEQSLSILTAGPEFMYMPLPKDLVNKKVEINIEYKGDPFHWFAFFVSIFSLLVVSDFLTFKLIRRFVKLPVSKAKESKGHAKLLFSKWWEKEEE